MQKAITYQLLQGPGRIIRLINSLYAANGCSCADVDRNKIIQPANLVLQDASYFMLVDSRVRKLRAINAAELNIGSTNERLRRNSVKQYAGDRWQLFHVN